MAHDVALRMSGHVTLVLEHVDFLSLGFGLL